MNRLIALVFLCCSLCSYSQVRIKDKKYPSLMWEITGNGLKKPSYLFGTMHVSSKIAFHLSDSFYLALRKADVVALETNPESWQEDLTRYELQAGNYLNTWVGLSAVPYDYLTIRSLQFDRYEKQVEQALFMQPSTINNLLYRNYSDYSSDFEEDTYLDMYIYQVGKKLGKRVAGVERYDESMKLMMEAYRDAAKDKNRKDRSYDLDEGLSPDNIQEAYRTGNLDLLDSINKLNSFSEAFDEKFLYKRNEIQANSIDSIMRTGVSLFVGVGAAHLPGNRGVIEMLREKGYKLRPVMMGERDSRHKEQVEKIRVPVIFHSQSAEDNFYKVDIPGKFYRFAEYGMLDQQQYADMANGSYYSVTRIKTNGLFWGHNEEIVFRKLDSVLYENVPGKILIRKPITRNGYKGFDITNRTRRGDLQRYNIFITPFEVLFFKMSGNGDYVKDGLEADKFFNSIQLKEYAATGWNSWQPVYGGFTVNLPHPPFESADGNRQYDAIDKNTGTHFKIIRTDIHNYSFAEEDAFDLGLMEESFASSEFIDKSLTRKFMTQSGYPALDVTYALKDGSFMNARFIIQGPHYYMLAAHATRENPAISQFLNSFTVRPFIYGKPGEHRDSALHYQVSSPVFPELLKEKLELPAQYQNRRGEMDEDDDDPEMESGIYRNKVISNDSTGEKIYVSFYKTPRYYYSSDSSVLDEETNFPGTGQDSSWIIRSKKRYKSPGGMNVAEYLLSDTASSRTLRAKSFYSKGVEFLIMTQGDTLTAPSSFVKNFFETFTPEDTITGVNPFTRKSAVFFQDFFSGDSISRKRATRAVNEIYIDNSDFALVRKAINSLVWSDRNYLEIKKSFIARLSEIPTAESSDFLKQLYLAAGDTVELQYAALESLLQHQTTHAFRLFRDIVSLDPPVIDLGTDRRYRDYSLNNRVRLYNARVMQSNNGDFLDELHDSLKLTRTILPDILPLINLTDYKWHIMRLLGRMVDSNLVTKKDYEAYFSKLFIEAKLELKKQAIAEKKKSIERAREEESRTRPYGYEDDETGYGNEDLSIYATLLLPYWENSKVPPIFTQMLNSADKRLRYNTMILMLRHGKPVHDSVLQFFGALDEYRYELYSDLKGMKKLSRFPVQFNNHIDLGKSKLLGTRSYNRPDSLVYVDRIATDYKGRKGFVYYFRYKQRKDDVGWKLATIGLVPQDQKQFEFEEPASEKPFLINLFSPELHEFTGFTDTRLKEEEPTKDQLAKAQKRMLVSKRKSGRLFYEEGNNSKYEYTTVMED